ncbi:hypothetical protein FRC05_004279 [Tulasnella sp. 425]|nr:hypothetical protein FRC05_004279 [Tulasnella sp. 425]
MADLSIFLQGFAVSPPFDPDSPGDCYLESLDGTRFKVLRHVLVYSSSYFETLLSDLSPSNSPNLPIFKIDEETRILHALLVVLYPVHTADFLNAPLLLELADRQEKYRIPETALMLGVAKVLGVNTRDPASVEHPMDLYAMAWRFAFRRESQYFSRYTHFADMMDEKTVERLVTSSRKLKAYIALVEMRQQRELALDDIVEALEPRKYVCASHSAPDKMFFMVVSMMKTAARNALLHPFPACDDAISFLGLQGQGEERTVTWCSSCYRGADREMLAKHLREAIGRYPQTTLTHSFKTETILLKEMMMEVSGDRMSPPFDAASPGDCFLQSTDGTRFKVLRHILVDASPYFANLLKEMPPSTPSKLPTFFIDEDAQMLHAVLAVLYPVHCPELLEASLLLKLAEREEKYGIPESIIIMPLSTAVRILRLRRTTSVEGAIDLFSLTWRFGHAKACQFISRHTHSVDLTDKNTVEKLVQSSKGIESYIALTDLRRQRELALDDVIEALEPRKHLCPSHSSSDKMFFTFTSMMKTAARNALLGPFPTCLDALSFLGIQGTDGGKVDQATAGSNRKIPASDINDDPVIPTPFSFKHSPKRIYRTVGFNSFKTKPMWETTQKTSNFTVPPPFDDASAGDSYLQSTDGIRFKVLRHILIHNSPHFADLLKEAAPTTHSQLPIFFIDEDAETLYAVLAFIYPVHIPALLEAPLLLKLAEREEKYGIPESCFMLPVFTAALNLLLRRTSPVEGAIDLFSLTWRFGNVNACRFLSRHTHSMDLTDKTAVEKLVRSSRSVESYIALTDLRRQRELALDDIVEALEPRKHVCPFHSSSDKMFFALISLMKTAARNALLDPFPTCREAFSFLGLRGTGGMDVVNWCSSCYAGADTAILTKQLQEAIDRYPQVISILPENDWPTPQ